MFEGLEEQITLEWLEAMEDGLAQGKAGCFERLALAGIFPEGVMAHDPRVQAVVIRIRESLEAL